MTPPATYIHGHAPSVRASHSWRTVENSAPHLLAELRPGHEILDVGCGVGTITIDLAERVGPTGRVVGLDGAIGVVGDVVARAAEREVDHVALVNGAAERLPFPDASFDVVHAHQVLQHVADPVAVLAEMGRVCRPGGVVAVRDADYAGMHWWPADLRLDRWLELYRRVARLDGGEPDAGRHLVRWARAAGFSSVRPSATAWCFATPEDRRWWGGTWAERVTSSTFAARALALGQATRAELDGLDRAWRDWADHPDATFVVPHVELLCHP